MKSKQKLYLCLSLPTALIWISLGIFSYVAGINYGPAAPFDLGGLIYIVFSFSCLGFSIPLLIMFILAVKNEFVRRVVIFLSIAVGVFIVIVSILLLSLTLYHDFSFAHVIEGFVSSIVIMSFAGMHFAIALLASEIKKVEN